MFLIFNDFEIENLFLKKYIIFFIEILYQYINVPFHKLKNPSSL